MANKKKTSLPQHTAKTAPVIPKKSETKRLTATVNWKQLANHPWLPGIFLFIIALLAALFTYTDYGMAWDEPFQRGPGLLSYNYMFHGSQELLQRPNDNHGAGFEILLIILEKALNLTDTRDIYLMRHLVTHLVFLIAAFSLYGLTLRLFKNKFLAILSFLMLALAPRLYAHSFINTKDIPFLSFLIIVFSLSNVVFERRKPVLFFVLGLVTGYATSIRIMGVMLACIILAFLVIDLVVQLYESKKPALPDAGPKAKPATTALSITFFAAAFCMSLYVAWPYLWKSPIHNFIESFSKLSRFELWNGSILLGGTYVQSEHLPWTYFPAWFLITNPELWLVCGFAGVGVLVFDFVKNPLSFLKNTSKRNYLFYLACFIVPIVAIIALHSVIYDDWRHLYFVYPSFILIAIYFIHKMLQTRFKLLAKGACITQLLFTGVVMFISHPFNQVYFNYFVSHAPGYLHNHYEMEYWGCSFKQGLEYLLQNDQKPVTTINCDYGVLLDNNIMMLHHEDRSRFRYSDRLHADYYMTNFRGHYIHYPSADSVFSINAMNSELLCIYKNEEDTSRQKKMLREEIASLGKLLTTLPDDLDAISRLAADYDLTGQFDLCELEYQKAIELSPTSTNMLNSLAGVYFKEKKFPKAIETFHKILAASPFDADPVANMAVCYYFNDQKDSAVFYLKHAISLSPGSAGYYLNLANTYNAMGTQDSARRYMDLYQQLREQK